VKTRRPLAIVAAAGLAIGLSACGSSSTSNQSTSTSTTINAKTITPIPAADLSPAGTAGKAPQVIVPSTPAPKNLEVADLITGTGPKAKAGDTVQVQYVLATYSSGGVVQSSWTSQPFSFTLGAGKVIEGWDLGVVGMQAGGRRELIIPAALGYGAQSPGPGIAANDTLVFVIDCISTT
jgi:peptidylprolyl isomerase